MTKRIIHTSINDFRNRTFIYPETDEVWVVDAKFPDNTYHCKEKNSNKFLILTESQLKIYLDYGQELFD